MYRNLQIILIGLVFVLLTKPSEPITLSAVTPSSGSRAGGTMLTITGTGFSAASGTSTSPDDNNGNRVQLVDLSGDDNLTVACDVVDYLSAWDQIVCETSPLSSAPSGDLNMAVKVTVGGVHIAVGREEGTMFSFTERDTAVVLQVAPHSAVEGDIITLFSDTKGKLTPEIADSSGGGVNVTLVSSTAGKASSPMTCEVRLRGSFVGFTRLPVGFQQIPIIGT